MSKKWSSFGEQQLLTENWREFLTEEVVELEESEEEIQERFRGKGGYVDRFKQSSKAFADKWKETRPKPMEDYPATELATILNMVYQEAGLNKDDDDENAKNIKDEIVKEFETMLKAQNFVIKEQSEQLIFAEKPVLDLERMPTLNGVLGKIEKDNPDAHKRIMSAFQRGGFKIGDAPAAQPAAQPAAAQQKQAQDDTPSAEPEQPIIDPKSAMDRAIDRSVELSGYPAPGKPEEIPTGDKAKQEPPETKDKVPDAQDQDSSTEEPTPEQKASNEIKNILKKQFESEAFKDDFPEYTDYDFDQQYAAFISDLRKLVSKMNELRRGKMASGLGIELKDINALANKYPPIFKVIARFQSSAEEQQMFLSDLLKAAGGTPKKAEKAPSPEEAPTVIKTPEEPEKEEFLKFPDDFPEDLKDIHRQANLSPFKNEDREQKMKLLKASKLGAMGIIMDLARDETMGGILQWKKTGEFEKGATKEPLEHWQKLYKKITDKEIRNLSKETRFLAKAYLLGLKNQIEQKGAIQEDKETLNESAMVRWKELAGIL